MTALVHPVTVDGRRLWIDGAMTDLIDKLHFGDPIRGWEGDERLAVYWNDPVWEVWRLEDDGEYRMVCRSAPGVPFDERLIDRLCEWDQRRRKRDLHREIVDHNERVSAQRHAEHDEYMTEEVVPRLRHAFRKDGDL